MVKLTLQPYDWVSSDKNGIFSIRIWCHDRDSERVLIRVEDYLPTVVVELPLIVGGRIGWTKSKLSIYINWLNKALGNHKPVEAKINIRKKLCYYNDNKYKFLILRFDTNEAARHCVNLLNKESGNMIQSLGFVKSSVRERNITDIHRLITECNLYYGQWFEAEAKESEEWDKISKCREYIASFKDLKSIDSNETMTWKVHPKVLSYDIESTSENHEKFPDPTRVNDACFQISLVVENLGLNNREKYLISSRPCGKIKDVKVINVNSEVELLDKFCQLIIDLDPSIITGYNIAKFDYRYLNDRFDIYFKEWPNMGLTDDKTYMYVNKWESAAYGKMIIFDLIMEGRISIDMINVIKRDYKMDNYKLETVGQKFLGIGKEDVTPKQMFREYDRSIIGKNKKRSLKQMAIIGNYCVQDSNLCIDLMLKLNLWVSLSELSSTCNVRIIDTVNRGQQIRVRNSLFRSIQEEGFIIDEKLNDKGFKGAHVFDPVPGKHHNILTFDFASLYPSIIRRFNICFTTLIPPESDIEDYKCNIITLEDGSIVKFIKKEYYHGFLPRMCEHYVLSRSKVRKQINSDNDKVINDILNQKQLALKVCANSIYGFLGVKKTRLSLIEGAAAVTAFGRMLIDKAAKHVEDNYNGRIVYGDTDSIMIDLGIKDSNDINYYKDKLEEDFKELYQYPLSLDFEKAFYFGIFIKKKRYVAFLTEDIKYDSIEKINDTDYKVISGDKVTYIRNKYGPKDGRIVGMKLDEKLEHDLSNLFIRGVMLTRRDNCKWMRDVYQKILFNALFDRSLNETLSDLDDAFLNLLGRNREYEDMIITMKIDKEYSKKATHPNKLFSEEMKAKGKPLPKGERLQFVYVEVDDDDERLGHKMRLWDDFWWNIFVEPLDPVAYIRKLNNSIMQIIYLTYKDEIDELSEHLPEPRRRKRGKIYTCVEKKYIENWVKMIKYKKKAVASIPEAVRVFNEE